MNEDYKFYLDMGYCPHCHKRKLAPGRHACPVCLRKNRERMAKVRERELEAQRADPNNHSHYKTPDKQLKAVRAYRERHKAQGLCVYCSNTAVPGIQLCERHRKQIAYQNNKRRYHGRHRPPREHLDPPTPEKKTKVDLGKLFALYNAGWRNRDIATELKVTESTVYRWLKIAKDEKEAANVKVS